jgi:GT2 family glycosyltransferase
MSTVAIVLCNYNHGKYLPESLGHLCRQTRPADQIVVKDCPPNFTVYDPLFTRLLARRPRDWDVLVVYAAWKLRTRRGESQLSWRDLRRPRACVSSENGRIGSAQGQLISSRSYANR